MKKQEPQWDKIEYTLMDVLSGAVGQLKSMYRKKMRQAESEAEKKWWLAQALGYDRLTGMVDPTNADEIQETINLVSTKIRELKKKDAS